jgi:hypothetical protein
MRSDVSSASFEHVQCRRKTTELQIFKKTVRARGKIMISTEKKWAFALLLLTNPLPLTILNNVSMKVVAIGGLLPLTNGPQRVIIMVIYAI